MASLDWEVVDVQNYVQQAQPYIRTMIKDPALVPSRLVGDVASTIVNRAWEDTGYHTTAAAICKHIVEKETEQQGHLEIPRYTFRTALVETCMLLVKDWEKLKEAGPDYWLSCCLFLGEVYCKVQPCHQPITALSRVLITVFKILASSQCINNFQEADLLCNLFHDCGRDLLQHNPDGLSEIVETIRDAFLDSNTEKSIQGLLLPLIELYASKFHLSQEAKIFYFQM